MEITNDNIKHVIRTCKTRNDYPTGRKSRYLSDVICREFCLPCMRVVEMGKCPKLKELFNGKEQNDGLHS